MDYEYHKIKSQIAVLKDVAKDYPTSSIVNAITQLEARLKAIEERQSKE